MIKPLLLVVDDDPMMANLVSSVGELASFDVRETTTAKEFQEAWVNDNPSVIVMDLIMPDIDGISLLMWLSEKKSSAPIILMSGYDGKYLGIAEHLGSGMGDNIIGTLTKPFKTDDLQAMLMTALEMTDTRNEVKVE